MWDRDNWINDIHACKDNDNCCTPRSCGIAEFPAMRTLSWDFSMEPRRIILWTKLSVFPPGISSACECYIGPTLKQTIVWPYSIMHSHYWRVIRQRVRQVSVSSTRTVWNLEAFVMTLEICPCGLVCVPIVYTSGWQNGWRFQSCCIKSRKLPHCTKLHRAYTPQLTWTIATIMII